MRGLRASALAISTICRRDSGRSLTSAFGWMSSAPARASASSAILLLRGAVDHAEALRRVRDDDVVGDAELGDQRQFLKYADDAGGIGGGRVGKAHLAAFHRHAALVRLHDSRHHLDQRGLAGAVLAQDRHGCARVRRSAPLAPAPARRRSAWRRPPCGRAARRRWRLAQSSALLPLETASHEKRRGELPRGAEQQAGAY